MAEGGRTAARRWAAVDLRRRWRSLVVLGLLAGVTAGLAMAALAGARRTDTALARLRSHTDASDAVVFSSQVGAFHPDWARLAAQPEVATIAVWDLVFGDVDGQPGELLFASDDGTFFGDVNRPVVTEGRMYDPAAPDEVVVSEAIRGEAPVGTTFTFRAYDVGQGDATDDRPAGPELTMEVVGVVRTVNGFLFTPEQVFLSPGFLARYRDEALYLENADIRLVNGAADIPALQRDVNELVAPGTPVLDLHTVSRHVDTTIGVEHTALWLLAAVVALAGGLLVSQALVRSAGVVGEDALVLRAVGMTRLDLAWAALQAHAVTVVVAVVTALAGAIGFSRWFPLGLARRIEHDVGTHADWLVLAPGAVLTGLLVAGGTLLVAARASSLRDRTMVRRPSAVVGAIRRRSPVTVGLGTSMAFERGRGRSSVAVGPALAAATVGVLGVVATLTIDHGINDSLSHPERAGVTWDATVLGQYGDHQPDGLRPELLEQVQAGAGAGAVLSVMDRQVIDVAGVGVPTFALRPYAGSPGPPVALAVTSGRAPAADDEAAIGPRTAKILEVGLGDTLAVGPGRHLVRIVGEALFPSDVHAEFDEGLWLTPGQLDTVVPPPASVEQFAGARAVAVRFPRGTDTGEAIDTLRTALGSAVQDVAPAEVPAELTNLRNVRVLPVLLAGFLAVLAIAAVSHVLVTSSRRRRHDFAILRAIGLSRRGIRLVLNSQGTAIGVVGLVVGVPLGIAVGRTGWHWVAERVPLEDVAPLAVIALLVIVPVTVIVVNALAVWPGHHVGRLQPADVLRAE